VLQITDQSMFYPVLNRYYFGMNAWPAPTTRYNSIWHVQFIYYVNLCTYIWADVNCNLCLKACTNNLREILVLVVLLRAPSRLKFTLLKQFLSRENYYTHIFVMYEFYQNKRA
jgi:hypothetical protein